MLAHKRCDCESLKDAELKKKKLYKKVFFFRKFLLVIASALTSSDWIISIWILYAYFHSQREDCQ